MNALRPVPASLIPLPGFAAEPESPWEARGFADLVPPATLTEARARRDELAGLLGRERAAAADFLLALADFDRRRGWERLGHASLFAFLTRELGLSNGAAYLRCSAARLLPGAAAVEAALRDGRLCLSAVGELARVLTADNEAAVLPRYFGRSAREAREVTAALLPRPDPPRREVVTMLAPLRRESPPGAPAELDLASPAAAVGASTAAVGAAVGTATATTATDLPPRGAPVVVEPLRAHEVEPTHPARIPRAEVEPLTADLRRLHLTVSAGFLEKASAARTGLSHAMPRATLEQVLEAALDLLLVQQSRRKALVKRPRAALPTPSPTPAPRSSSLAAHPEPFDPASPPRGCAQDRLRVEGAKARETPSPASSRPHLPAAVEREVRLRDGDRCQWPLDAGGVCGSTWQVELDHVVPHALGGPIEVGNLRCACKIHNQRAAALVLGAGLVADARARRR